MTLDEHLRRQYGDKAPQDTAEIRFLLGVMIEARREESGLGTTTLARLAKVDRSSVLALREGRPEDCPEGDLLRLADALFPQPASSPMSLDQRLAHTRSLAGVKVVA